MRAGNGASAVNQVASVTGLHVERCSPVATRWSRNLRAGNARVFEGWCGERPGENEGQGTVRNLDRLSGSFSVA